MSQKYKALSTIKNPAKRQDFKNTFFKPEILT